MDGSDLSSSLTPQLLGYRVGKVGIKVRLGKSL